MKITPKLIREKLREKMIDPELGMNVVDLGLIYDIKIASGLQLTANSKKEKTVKRKAVNREPSASSAPKVHILMTLTTPGCPLAAVFTPLVRQALSDIPGLDPYKDVEIELTFDPPWHTGMMSERAKAEMGYS